MTFKPNQRAFSRRREGSHIGYGISSGTAKTLWKNTGAGGTLQFTGLSDSYVRYSNSGTNLKFGAGPNPYVPEDFTIEWWQFETDTNGAPRPWGFGPWPQTQLGISFEGSPETSVAYIWGFGGVTFSAPVGDIRNTSKHFALVRNHGLTSLFMDGKSVGSSEDNYDYNAITYDLVIGSEGGTYDSQCFGGYITNFNIVKYAKYTSDFTPTQTALSIDSAEVLLIPAWEMEAPGEPYGSYVGSPSFGNGFYWENLTPFKYPAPSPFVTFPYPAALVPNGWTFNNQGNRWSVLRDYSGFWMYGGGYLPQSYVNNSFRVFESYQGYWQTGWLTMSELVSQGWLNVNNSYTCPDGGVPDGNGNCVLLPSVSGGSVYSQGDYYYRAFLASDSIQITNSPLTAEVLLIAGGGGGGAGGGYEAGGGGGAGGVLHLPAVTFNEGSYPVIVGSGGAFNANGGDSYIQGLTDHALGGGFGGPYGAGNSGGSGGGAPGWGAHNQPGSGTAGQGNRGGYGTYDYGASLPGGGGGASEVGGDASSYNHGGNGGSGTSAFSDWGIATNTGHLVATASFYAGGGGGGTNWGQWLSAGSGALGGGGNGGATGSSGMSSTGGGGGGSNNDYSSAGNGGSGVVILKYLKSEVM